MTSNGKRDLNWVKFAIGFENIPLLIRLKYILVFFGMGLSSSKLFYTITSINVIGFTILAVLVDGHINFFLGFGVGASAMALVLVQLYGKIIRP